MPRAKLYIQPRAISSKPVGKPLPAVPLSLFGIDEFAIHRSPDNGKRLKWRVSHLRLGVAVSADINADTPEQAEREAIAYAKKIAMEREISPEELLRSVVTKTTVLLVKNALCQ